MPMCDWSSDVCSSDLVWREGEKARGRWGQSAPQRTDRGPRRPWHPHRTNSKQKACEAFPSRDALFSERIFLKDPGTFPYRSHWTEQGLRPVPWLQVVLGKYLASLSSFPGGSGGKESACSAGDQGSIPGLGRFPWRRKWQPTPVFLPGKSHGWRSLVGCSPWGH